LEQKEKMEEEMWRLRLVVRSAGLLEAVVGHLAMMQQIWIAPFWLQAIAAGIHHICRQHCTIGRLCGILLRCHQLKKSVHDGTLHLSLAL
jgi:hypothetical protein